MRRSGSGLKLDCEEISHSRLPRRSRSLQIDGDDVEVAANAAHHDDCVASWRKPGPMNIEEIHTWPEALVTGMEESDIGMVLVHNLVPCLQGMTICTDYSGMGSMECE